VYHFGAHNILMFCHCYARYLQCTANSRGTVYPPVGYPGSTWWVPERIQCPSRTRVPDGYPISYPGSVLLGYGSPIYRMPDETILQLIQASLCTTCTHLVFSTGQFYQRLLRVRPVPKIKLFRTVMAELLQAGCPSCHPTNCDCFCM